MAGSIARWLDSLIDHYVTVCVFLALFILTWVGVGDVRIVSMLGLILCVVGLVQGPAQVDLWIFVPLVVYDLMSAASSYAAYGNIVDGLASTQLIYLALYLLIAGLSGGELRLLKRSCVLWAGIVALAGIGQYALRTAVVGGGARLSGILGNPNAMGIFLVVGWFALMHCGPEEGETPPRWVRLLPRLEPVLLTALALTLSLGSFIAMAGGILWLAAAQARRTSFAEASRSICRLLAKATLGMGTGLLIYLTATRTNVPWACLPMLLYVAAMAACWDRLERFLDAFPKIAAAIAAAGSLVAAGAVVIRPSALDTFAERLEMMGSALRYLTEDPLLGVGPYRWRLLDMHDGGTYFATWHIHNALLHVGVELGWIAMAMIAAVAVRALLKRSKPAEKAGLAAFILHTLIDTSFFHMGDFTLAMMTACHPQTGGKTVSRTVLRLLFGAFAARFAWGLWLSVRMI